MGLLMGVFARRHSTWYTATYLSDEEVRYEIAFVQTFNADRSRETRSVVCVRRGGQNLDPQEPVWAEVRKAVDGWR